MRISTLGSGKVAHTLGSAWVAQGHEVYIGARQPHAASIVARQQKQLGSNKVRVGSLQEASAFGEVVLLAINPWTEIEKAVKPLAQELKGKVIIDVSNNIDFGAPPKMAFTRSIHGRSYTVLAA